MGNIDTTYYIPSEDGWTSGNYYLRLKVRQQYNTGTNKSAITVTPQFSAAYQYGNYNLYDQNNTSKITYKIGSASAVDAWSFHDNLTPGQNVPYRAVFDTSWKDMERQAGDAAAFPTSVSFDVTHGNDGKASVTFTIINVKASSGGTVVTFGASPNLSHTMTLNGDARTYTLTVSTGDANSSVTVKKGNTVLPGGSTVTYNDVLTITANASSGYTIKTFTVNGSSKTSPYTHTVKGNVSVYADSEANGLVYVKRSGTWQAHAVYIKRSGAWVRHRPYIKVNGTWVPYG